MIKICSECRRVMGEGEPLEDHRETLGLCFSCQEKLVGELSARLNADHICLECRKPCTISLQEFGVGRVEVWGAVNTARCLAWASDCCSADFTGYVPEDD